MASKDVTFPAKTIAKLLDLTVARVGQLAKEGVITKLETGRYPADAIPQYIRWLRDKAFGSDIGGDTNKERARLLRAQADKAEMDNEVRRGELAPIDTLEECLVDVLRQQAAIFDSIPGEIKRNVPGLSNKGIEIVKREVAKARNLAADVTLSTD